MVLDSLAALGRRGMHVCGAFGRAGLMLFGALVGRPQPTKQFPLLLRQLYSVGVQSLLIIIVSGLFIGMVLALQGYIISALKPALVRWWRYRCSVSLGRWLRPCCLLAARARR